MSPRSTRDLEVSASEPRGPELIARYKKNYAIPDDVPLSEQMILRHWDLERCLTRELLASTPENRREVFERSYAQLYRELEWLNRCVATSDPRRLDLRARIWRRLIGRPPKKIYEIGSGQAELISSLAREGFTCRATEITEERGSRHASDNPNLSWGHSDGVHLEKFEPGEVYDVVISDNVIEHLHPDDLSEHFSGVSRILKCGGKYIFCTPHRYAGPSDVSAVFGCDGPMGMHLREYTYGELSRVCHEAGFRNVQAVFTAPLRLGPLAGRIRPFASRTYLHYLGFFEKTLNLIRRNRLRRTAARALRLVLFNPTIFMVAHKE